MKLTIILKLTKYGSNLSSNEYINKVENVIAKESTVPVNTRRYLDVDSTFFERYGRQMDVKTTVCLLW